MYRFVGVAFAAAFAAAFSTSPAFATNEAVIDQCKIVVDAEQSAADVFDHHWRGTCVRATINYLNALKSADLTIDELGVEVTTLVVDLSNILVLRTCRPKSEILEAMMLAAEVVDDPKHQVALHRHAAQVTTCPAPLSVMTTGIPASYS